MAFTLRKPPVIEAWIEASMLPSQEAEWKWDDADEVLRSFGADLTEFEHLPAYTPEAKKFDKNKRPTEIQIRVEPNFLRVRNPERTKLVQIGQNRLLVTLARKDDNHYPRFKELLAFFDDSLERYLDRMRVAEVRSAELHYVDLIIIPGIYGSDTSLSDFFVGAPSLPIDPFGELSSAAWSMTFVKKETNLVAQLAVRMQEPDGQDGRFRMDWHCWCFDVCSTDRGVIADRLELAHTYLLLCFQAAFTPVVWKSFQPEE